LTAFGCEVLPCSAASAQAGWRAAPFQPIVGGCHQAALNRFTAVGGRTRLGNRGLTALFTVLHLFSVEGVCHALIDFRDCSAVDDEHGLHAAPIRGVADLAAGLFGPTSGERTFRNLLMSEDEERSRLVDLVPC
jgi:hypothetical protein